MYTCPNCGHHRFETESRFTRRVIVTGIPAKAPVEEALVQIEHACYGTLICCQCGQRWHQHQVELDTQTGRLPRLTQEEYRTNDREGQCPECREEDYSPGRVSWQGGQVAQDRHCRRCGFRWYAVFRIAGYLRHGAEEADTDALASVWCVDTAPPEEPTACVIGMCVNNATCPRQLHCRRHACDCPEEGDHDA